MTRNQIEWASQHDWFIGVIDGPSIVVQERWSDGSRELRTFTTFKALYHWARYVLPEDTVEPATSATPATSPVNTDSVHLFSSFS